MSYKIIISKTSEKDFRMLKKSEPKIFNKALQLIAELQEHPTAGTGKPKPLGGNRTGQWSRRISPKHRLIYQINEDEIMILILSAYGHYNNK